MDSVVCSNPLAVLAGSKRGREHNIHDNTEDNVVRILPQRSRSAKAAQPPNTTSISADLTAGSAVVEITAPSAVDDADLRADTLKRTTQAAYEAAKIRNASAAVREAIQRLREARLEGKDSADVRTLKIYSEEDLKRLKDLGYKWTSMDAASDYGPSFVWKLSIKD